MIFKRLRMFRPEFCLTPSAIDITFVHYAKGWNILKKMDALRERPDYWG